MYASAFGFRLYICLNKLFNKNYCAQVLSSGESENTSRGRGDDELARAVSLSLEVDF